MTGSSLSHQDQISRLSAASKCAILSIDYRLAPEFPYPTALEDTMKAYHWLVQRSHLPQNISLVGCSAGGNLALSLLLKLKLEKKALPASAYLLAPWVDLAMKGPSLSYNQGNDILSFQRLVFYRDAYVGSHSTSDPFISPIYAHLAGLPPIFIQTGTRDLLHSESVALSERLKSAGTDVVLDIWPDMIHHWPLFSRDFPEGQQATERAAQFIIRAFLNDKDDDKRPSLN